MSLIVRYGLRVWNADYCDRNKDEFLIFALQIIYNHV